MAIESLTRQLAAELGPRGVRVVCLRPDALSETWPEGFRDQDLDAGEGDGTLLGRLPALVEVAHSVTFMASGRASAMTGTVANVSCGSIVE